MATKNINIRIEEDLKKESEQAFQEVENNELEVARSVEELWEKLNGD